MEKKMIQYYENNYINGNYDKSVWWVGDLLKKTNNSVESFNSMFNRIVKIPIQYYTNSFQNFMK